MASLGTEKLQLGQAGPAMGLWSNILAGALEVEIYVCRACGKMELYAGGPMETEEELPQKTCPHCGRLHDFDYPKCPLCGYV